MDFIELLCHCTGGYVEGTHMEGDTQIVTLMVPKAPEKPSFVYLMQDEKGYTKIGISRRPTVREKTLQ